MCVYLRMYVRAYLAIPCVSVNDNGSEFDVHKSCEVINIFASYNFYQGVLLGTATAATTAATTSATSSVTTAKTTGRVGARTTDTLYERPLVEFFVTGRCRKAGHGCLGELRPRGRGHLVSGSSGSVATPTTRGPPFARCPSTRTTAASGRTGCVCPLFALGTTAHITAPGKS